MRLLFAGSLLLLLASCNLPDTNHSEREIAELKAEIEALKAAPKAAAASAAPELGAQMLELQMRHARLWQAVQSQNFMLAQFQLAELREAFDGVVESNGEHASLQPNKLSEVLPAMVGPALGQLQAAVDGKDAARLEAGYDALSDSCNECHAAAAHGFLVIQRPKTPVLDNLRAEATAGE